MDRKEIKDKRVKSYRKLMWEIKHGSRRKKKITYTYLS